MIWKTIAGAAALGILALGVAAALYQPLIRPWHSRWGAVQSEVEMSLPGDEILSGELTQTTRAIAVRAAPDRVSPWLLQLGQGRGGMFSYDFLENLAGCDIHTLDQIDPALQNLQVGDKISMGPQEGLPYYKVVLLEPEKALVLRSIQPATGEPGETWGFYLLENPAGHTRLVIRHRTPPSQNAADRVFNAIFEPISFIMEHRMLYGLRDHAENLSLAAPAAQ